MMTTRPGRSGARGRRYQGAPPPGRGGPAIVNTMVRADGGECDVASYGKHNGGFYHTSALEQGDAELATLVFYNFEVVEATLKGLTPRFFSLKDWGVPDFCQLVLFTTPERFEALKPALRKMVLAIRRAVGLIHRAPAIARDEYLRHVSERGEAPAGEAAVQAVVDV